MTADVASTQLDVEALRERHYNASAAHIERCHDELMILRVQPDRGIPEFVPGQYTVLGLGYWEPRIAGTQAESLEPRTLRKLIKRAYSISCSLIGLSGEIVRARECDYLEFYVTLVRQAAHPPALTPRLFGLSEGDRLYCGPHAHGNYTLSNVPRDATVIFAATGTGEAPHNAMLSELLATGHRGRIVSVACVRCRADLGYLSKHRALEQRFEHDRYLTLTTREPENVDPTSAGYIGKRYLQDYFASGEFERSAGLKLTPRSTHVFLCGSPQMIGVPHHTHDPARRYPRPTGMVEVLERRGFRVDQSHEPGNIHFEKYW